MTAPQWRKSSHSGGENTDCVEVAALCASIAVRDSKDPGGPILTLTRRSFAALLDTVKSGHLEP